MMSEKEREVLRRLEKENKDTEMKENEVFKEEVQNETIEPRPRLIILANNIGRTLK